MRKAPPQSKSAFFLFLIIARIYVVFARLRLVGEHLEDNKKRACKQQTIETRRSTAINMAAKQNKTKNVRRFACFEAAA